MATTNFESSVDLLEDGNVTQQPVQVAERCKARVYGRSFDGIAGSNSAGGMDVCVV